MTGEQIIIVGVVATALTFILRVLFTYANVQFGRLTVNILLYVVSGVLAFLFTKPALPPIGDAGDIGAWILSLFQLIGPAIALASLIYNALYSQVVVPLWAKFAKS